MKQTKPVFKVCFVKPVISCEYHIEVISVWNKQSQYSKFVLSSQWSVV